MMLIALIALAKITPAPPPEPPVVTTIAALRANPRKFDGAVIRLRGWVNSCERLACAIEERPKNSPQGGGQSLSIGDDGHFDTVVKPLTPTFVEFDATFDATCLTNVCTHRAPILRIVQLRSVIGDEPPVFED
jgi:hypothetical protein